MKCRKENTFRVVDNGKTFVKYVNDCVTFLLVQSDDIDNLCNLEVISIINHCPCENQEDLEKAALHTFRKIFHIKDNRRYEISLLWLENKVIVPSNRESTGRRLRYSDSKRRRDVKLNATRKYSKSGWLMLLYKNDGKFGRSFTSSFSIQRKLYKKDPFSL